MIKSQAHSEKSQAHVVERNAKLRILDDELFFGLN